jgi:hypothetical protein
MAEETEGGSAARELASVQSAARWLVGGGAAVLAALVAGLQLSAIAQLTFDSAVQLGLTAGAFVVALVSIIVLLVLAARVLVYPGWTLHRMTDLQDADPGKWQKHWLREYLTLGRGLLVTDANFDPGLIFDRHRMLLVAWSELHERGETVVPDDVDDTSAHPPTHTYKADDSQDVERLERRLANASATTERVEAAANLVDVRRRYRRLVRLLPVLGLVPVAALLYVLWSAATTSDIKLTTPVNVTVQFNNDPNMLAGLGIPRVCANQRISGVAVAGSLTKPKITSISNPACLLNQTEVGPTVGVVVPIVPSR